MKCCECSDLKCYYHGPNSKLGQFSYFCARTLYNIEHPEEEPRAEICQRSARDLRRKEELHPYEWIRDDVDCYARVYGYDDFLVTLSVDGRVITELLLGDNGELEWVNDWWEGETDIRLLGFIPVPHIKVYATAVEIGRPVFGPDPVRVHMTSIGKYRLEVLSDGT